MSTKTSGRGCLLPTWRMSTIAPLMPGLSSTTIILSLGLSKRIGWRSIGEKGKKLYGNTSRITNPAETRFTRINAAAKKKLLSRKMQSRNFCHSCVIICVITRSSIHRQCPLSTKSHPPLLDQFGFVRRRKCMRCARSGKKDMRGNIFGQTGIGSTNGHCGHERLLSITTQSFKRMLLSKSIGATSRIEFCTTSLTLASIVFVSRYTVQLCLSRLSKSASTERG